MDTKFAKPSTSEKPNVSKTVEKPKMSISRFAPKVDEKNDLTKPVTPQPLPKKKEIEKIVKKQKLVVESNTNAITPGPSRNRTPNVTTKTVKESVGSNDMVHNHHLEEARKKAKLRNDGILGEKPSVMNYTRFQSTASSSKPLPRNNQQNTREWLASKSSCAKENVRHVDQNTMNSKSSLNKNQSPNDCSVNVKVAVLNKNVEFVCPTCQKCVFSANHDACVAQYIMKENACSKVQSTKKPNRNKPVDKKQEAKKPNRWISIGRSFSQNETSAASEKKTTPRSCLRWTPTGKVFNTVGLRWTPTGKIFDAYTKTNNSENHQDKEVEITTIVDRERTQREETCSSNTVICDYSSSVDAGTCESFEVSYTQCGKELYANIARGNPFLIPLLLVQA